MPENEARPAPAEARLARVAVAPSAAAGATEQERAARPLTDRESTVLALVVEGKRNGEISEELQITERTVKFHVSGLLAKLGVSSRTQLVSVALREGLLDR